MNAGNAHLFKPLVDALAACRTIQVKAGDNWRDLEAPSFDGPPESYRIKPEPIVTWAVVRPNRQIINILSVKSHADILSSNYCDCRVIKLKEVE